MIRLLFLLVLLAFVVGCSNNKPVAIYDGGVVTTEIVNNRLKSLPLGIAREYRTIEKPAEGIYREKGSRFLAFGYPVANEDSAREFMNGLRKKYHDARHYCYAYRLVEGKLHRYNDDGEPSGTAGKPIFSTIISNDLNNILIAVVRYFGGTLLGRNRLLNAYRSASLDMISNAGIIECHIENIYRFEFPYIKMNEVMNLIKEESLPVIHPEYNESCSFYTRIRKSNAGKILGRIEAVAGFKWSAIKEIK